MKPLVLFLSILLVVPGVVSAIPDPSAVYCIEQGYEYENGACIFPDGSKCSAWHYYCKCEPNGIGCWPGDFNCGFPCQELSCREAGQFVSIGKCCPGLAEIPRIEAYDDQCNLVGWLGWVFLCSDCGNGVCESWESICNCPEDCARIHNITQNTYYETIQDAIDDANDGDTVIVADGTYTGLGNRDIDFLGKAITVRSESGPENCFIDCNGTEAEPHRGFHFISGEDANSVLDGFTITNGYGLEGPFASHTAFYGGSIYCNGSGPMITNCLIKGNKATFGAGIFAERNSSPIITNCTISGNTKPGGGGQQGGGIYCWRDATAKITDCTVSSNAGVGIYCLSSSAEIINCEITKNSVEGICFSNDIINNCIISNNGGAGIVYHSDATISNCIISGNQDPGINVTGGTPTIDNCTITAGRGRGVSCSRGNTIITNSIVWNNTGEDIYVWNYPQPPGGGGSGSTKLSVSYSCTGEPVVEEDAILILGPGNISADPCFFEPGYWDANGLWVEGDYHLLPDSPCIDAGDPNYVPAPNETDLDGNPRVTGYAVDMGAYEHQQPVLAEIDIKPKTLNLQSSGKSIACHIRLPEGYTVADIDPNSILLEGQIGANSVRSNHRQQTAIVTFSRSDVQDIFDVGQTELTITGQLTDGTEFEGTDSIRVIDRHRPK